MRACALLLVVLMAGAPAVRLAEGSLPCLTGKGGHTAAQVGHGYKELASDRAASARGSGSVGGLPPGPFKVEHSKIDHVPGLTLGGPHSAEIYWPVSNTTHNGNLTNFPLLGFAHGTTVGSVLPPTADTYADLLRLVASYGFVIVAPNSCPVIECYSTFAKDQLATIAACRSNRTLHPGLAHADLDTVGVFGHSMGAMATIVSAGGGAGKWARDPADYGIKAAVSMHPCGDPVVPYALGNLTVPILFTAGSVDTICEDECALKDFDKLPSTLRRIFFDIDGVGHFEPTNVGNNHEDLPIALFFSCELRGENCDRVYGSSGKQICQQSFKMAKCDVLPKAGGA